MSSLEEFQAALLTALDRGEDPSALIATAPSAELAAWMASWDTDCVALAGELIRTWGTRY